MRIRRIATGNHYMPEEVSRQWTRASRECYNNSLMCFRFSLPEDIKAQCRMKGVVLDLVMKYEKPHKERKEECLSDYQREN